MKKSDHRPTPPRWADRLLIWICPPHLLEELLGDLHEQFAFKEYVPGMPFDYKFADEQYAKKFYNEVRIGKLALVFASLAILISCLGLFGLASFVAEQRTKEIGIRKRSLPKRGCPFFDSVYMD